MTNSVPCKISQPILKKTVSTLFLLLGCEDVEVPKY